MNNIACLKMVNSCINLKDLLNYAIVGLEKQNTTIAKQQIDIITLSIQIFLN